MSRGSTASWDEATRCYKCEQPGVEVAVNPARERHQGKVHTIECQNNLCINFEQRWIVQVRPDGTIPVGRETGERSFPAMTEGMQSVARRGLEQLEEEQRRERN